MDQKHTCQCKHNHEGNGFLLGLIIGVLVTLVLTTKKGRELYKELTQKGFEKWEELEKAMQDLQSPVVEDEMDDEDTSDYIEPEEKKEVKYLAKETSKSVREEEVVKPAPKAEKKVTEKTISGRRWFKGLRKKTS